MTKLYSALKTHPPRRELDWSRPSEVIRVWREKSLPGTECWGPRGCVVADGIGAKVSIVSPRHIENIEKQIRVMAFSAQGEILYEPKVEVGEPGLSCAVSQIARRNHSLAGLLLHVARNLKRPEFTPKAGAERTAAESVYARFRRYEG